MAKIKVVQIAMAASSEEWDTQYLDDKGRVWRQVFKLVDNPDENATSKKITEYFWTQIELPDEPEN